MAFKDNFGHDGHYEKVDWTASRLKYDSRTDGHLLRRSYARVTPPGLDVKGVRRLRRRSYERRLHRALDIHPHRHYVVNKLAAGAPAASPESILLYLLRIWSLHRIWD